MPEQEKATRKSRINLKDVFRNKCRLTLRNRSGTRLNIVLHGTDHDTVKAFRVRRYRRIKLPKGTYVMEAWLNDGRIGIKYTHIPHINIEKITSRRDVSIRGRKIVADFVNDKAHLEFNRDISVVDIVEGL